MKKALMAIMILTSFSSFALEFKVICSSDEGGIKDTSRITKNITTSINSQLKEFGDKVIDVSPPNSNMSSWQKNGDLQQLTCVTVKLIK